MIRFFQILWSLMRYRTMLVIVLFFWLSLLLHHAHFDTLYPTLIAMVAVLIGLHIAGTAWNDWADYKIDQVNLKGHKDRPLVSGAISRSQLAMLAVGISCITLVAAFIIDIRVGIVTFIILVCNSQYSLRPLHIAYRQWVVPFYLPIGYVGAPLLFGFFLGSSTEFYVVPCLGMYALFVARVSLKDFRDRKGDKKFHKPTLILRHGKRLVCSLCATMVILGSLLLVSSTKVHFISVIIAAFCITTLWIIHKLYHETNQLRELLLIGLGARLGNGLVISYAAYLLTAQEAIVVQIALCTSLALIYSKVVFEHIAHPDTFHFGRRQVS